MSSRPGNLSPATSHPGYPGFVAGEKDVNSRLEDLLDTLSTLLSDNSPLSKDDSPHFALSMQIDSSVRRNDLFCKLWPYVPHDVHSRIEDLLDTLSTLLSDNSPLSKDDSPRFALSMQIDSSVRYMDDHGDYFQWNDIG
ncbi:hypothetical protein Tco_0072334 [Tanacetum coccineum]